MKPIKPEVIYENLAHELKIPERDIINIIDYYFKCIARKIKDGTVVRIRLARIGEFAIIHKRLTKKIEKLEDIKEAKKDSKTMQDFAIIKNINESLEKFYEVRRQILKEYEKKKTKKIERREYVTNKNMERKREDS